MQERKPIFLCVCGPTASGKSTLCRELLKQSHDIRLSVSTTTRRVRAGETDGKDYYFVSEDEFQRRIDAGLFLEYASFSGNRYGTEKRNFEGSLNDARDVLLDIDVQGVQQLKQLYPENVVTVFVFPPSFTELRQRLIERGTEDVQTQEKRLQRAREEIAVLSSPQFSDYLLINTDLTTTVLALSSIISAERMRFRRIELAFSARIFQE